jgi:hypothetical protein
MWELEEALELIRALQEKAWSFGYHLCLGGGVLQKGRSEKDLDLYFLELDNPKYKVDTTGLITWLDSIWEYKRDLWVEYNRAGDLEMIDREGSGIYTRKMEYLYSGTHRIDVFVV